MAEERMVNRWWCRERRRTGPLGRLREVAGPVDRPLPGIALVWVEQP